MNKLENAYNDYLNKKCKRQEKLPFKKVVQFQVTEKLGIGDIAYMPSFNGGINLFICKKKYDKAKRYEKLAIIDKSITSNDLLYYFNQKPIAEYLQSFGKGAIHFHIPKSAFNRLIIPKPQGENHTVISKTRLSINNSSFKILFATYYQQYTESYKSQNYLIAAIMAGAIAEIYLYNFLIEIKLKDATLDGKTLGALIHLAEAYLLSSVIDDFPLNHFREVQKLRNKAVHPKLANELINKRNQISDASFDGFNQLIKYFGLS